MFTFGVAFTWVSFAIRHHTVATVAVRGKVTAVCVSNRKVQTKSVVDDTWCLEQPLLWLYDDFSKCVWLEMTMFPPTFWLCCWYSTPSSGLNPRWTWQNNMRLLLLPGDTEIGSVIYRLRASDADENYPLEFKFYGKTLDFLFLKKAKARPRPRPLITTNGLRNRYWNIILLFKQPHTWVP